MNFLFPFLLQDERAISRRALHVLFKGFPSLFWQHVDAVNAAQGWKQCAVSLSYDCDTDDDAEAFTVLYAVLKKAGLPASFCVPGEQLRRNSSIYKRLAEDGAIFLNHGDRPHSLKTETGYQSINSYVGLTPEAIREDMHRGHEAVERITGCRVRGFRTPHFGHFQKPDQLALIHRFCHELGYRYSSSSGPAYAWCAPEQSEVTEYPLSSSYRTPLVLFDSWTYARRLPSPYVAMLLETIRLLSAMHFRGLLNVYADPSHVLPLPGYLDALLALREQGVSVISLDERHDL